MATASAARSAGSASYPMISGEADPLKLTVRQREVLSLIAYGMSNKVISPIQQ